MIGVVEKIFFSIRGHEQCPNDRKGWEELDDDSEGRNISYRVIHKMIPERYEKKERILSVNATTS